MVMVVLWNVVTLTMMIMNTTNATPSAVPTPTKAACHVVSLPTLEGGFEGDMVLIGVPCFDGVRPGRVDDVISSSVAVVPD